MSPPHPSLSMHHQPQHSCQPPESSRPYLTAYKTLCSACGATGDRGLGSGGREHHAHHLRCGRLQLLALCDHACCGTCSRTRRYRAGQPACHCWQDSPPFEQAYSSSLTPQQYSAARLASRMPMCLAVCHLQTHSSILMATGYSLHEQVKMQAFLWLAGLQGDGQRHLAGADLGHRLVDRHVVWQPFDPKHLHKGPHRPEDCSALPEEQGGGLPCPAHLLCSCGQLQGLERHQVRSHGRGSDSLREGRCSTSRASAVPAVGPVL